MRPLATYYSVTCAEALLTEVIPLFKITAPLQCEFWCQGLNDSYKITTASDTFILRIYRHGWRDLGAINFEIEALLHLHKNGVNVAYPIATKQGDYVVSMNSPEGLRYIIITRYIEGEELRFSKPQSAQHYGQHLAQIHHHSTDFSSQQPRFKLDVTHLISQPMQRIQPFLKNQPDDWQFLTEYAEKLSGQLQKALQNSQDIGFCHADFHGGNAHLHNNQLGSFDFDCCAIGLRVYDLAVFKWALQVGKKEESIWQTFLCSYQKVRPLADAELTYINALVSIRQIWLMGLHIDIAVAKGWLDKHYFKQKLQFLRERQQQG